MPEGDDLRPQEGSAAESAPAVIEPLYPGDCGELPLEARRALVQLLSGPSLDARRHPRLWAALVEHRQRLASRLADLFLELVMDRDEGIAFVRQADAGELDAPILLRRKPLTFIESALLLYLRGLLADAEVRGERAVVSGAEMLEQMQLYEPADHGDPAGFERRARRAMEKLKDSNLITAIRSSDDRYEVSPTLRLLFSAEEVAALARIYQALGRAPSAGQEDEPPEVSS